MRYLILFILTISSLCSAEQVYWKAGGHSAPTANAAAKALCDWNTICSNFTIEPYRSNPSRHDLLTVVYYSDSVNYPVWKVDNIRMLPCGYDDFSVCSTFDHEQNVTVCSDGFYSNAGNLIGYVNTCDRPELKQCNDGSGSSASASSAGGGGSGSSAGSGECDPTAKNYLECLGTKELEIPTEGGSFDGVGTNSEDRIAELEVELNDVINQVTSEINDSIGVTLSGSGGLSDYTYSIKGVSVSFGWTRFASYLSLLGYAIIAAAYVAAFIIIMRH